MNSSQRNTDVVVIGAGPAGAIAAALLRRHGHAVTVVERQHFPRFSIGESLLPQCMEFIAEAGMGDAVNAAGFQFKNGAAFTWNRSATHFDFTEKFTAGPGTTFQVQRGRFDQILAEEATRQGADIRFGHGLESLRFDQNGASLHIGAGKSEGYTLDCRFVLDASGFGRVLPRLLELERPSAFPSRTSLFTHVQDHMVGKGHDRNKILIAIHPVHRDVWYWLIPFADGRCSLGVVAENHYFEQAESARQDEPPAADLLREFVSQEPRLSELLADAVYDTPVQRISGYSCDVKSLWGERFALLGNAGEFLDPVFSSGVTIAMKSASLAVPLVDRVLRGEAVDWEKEYATPLKQGVDTFRAYVDAWYDGRFQDVVFAERASSQVRDMISSILAGYAWDTENPFVAQPRRRLNALVELCREP